MDARAVRTAQQIVGETVKVYALCHFYMPWRSAGSEVVLHELLKAAVEAGHEATVWVTNQDAKRTWRGTESDIELDGVTVKRVRNVIMGARAVASRRPDVIVSHHDHTMFAIKTARQVGARSVFLTHNDMDINQRPLVNGQPDLVIFNSEWVKESLSRFGTPKESLVFHPPLTPDRHKVASTGDHITLVNLNAHKGAELFYQLAQAMPDHKFLGVIGGHGQQVIRRTPNVTIAEHHPDMKRVWSNTRVLLMPSLYESYGLVAVEAGLNGIPTIANPTPGLRENLGAGGLFADRDRLEDWQKMLGGLDDPRTYKQASEYALQRAEDALKKTRDTLTTWVAWLNQ